MQHLSTSLHNICDRPPHAIKRSGPPPSRVVEATYGRGDGNSLILPPHSVCHLPRGLQDFVGLERSRHEHQQLYQHDEHSTHERDDQPLGTGCVGVRSAYRAGGETGELRVRECGKAQNITARLGRYA